MTSRRPTVVLGILGGRLDAGQTEDRWSRWRPTVSLCQHEDLVVDRLELIHLPAERDLAAGVVSDIRSVSPETIPTLHEIGVADPWDFEEVFASLHGFARSMRFRTDEEDYLVHITTGTHVQQICLYLLAESRHLPGRLLQCSPPRRGRADAGQWRTIDLDLSRYDSIAARFALEQREDLSFLKSGIDTRSPAFNALIGRIERVAVASPLPILLTGATGAGKSHLARRIYDLKRRRELMRGNFVEVNCATLRGDQAMSALFGHARGAFTGAAAARAGLLRAADGGMLFLDEIGELGLDEQAMLLRAIEERRFLPVGSDAEVASDFQLLAGTNADLSAAVGAGRFRADLLARIDLWTFSLPGLAARREDIAPNLDYELDRFAARSGRRVTINREARERFLTFAEAPDAPWPGNFRDLSAAVTRMATLAPSGRIGPADVDEEIGRLRIAWGGDGAGGAADDPLAALLPRERLITLDLFDRLQLNAVVEVCRRSRSLSAAGRELFAVSRQAKASPNDADRLRKYLARFGLAWHDVASR
ncbi:MAG: RNA repair transcriptional activator RtcR [Planctomycetia bacterium]